MGYGPGHRLQTPYTRQRTRHEIQDDRAKVVDEIRLLRERGWRSGNGWGHAKTPKKS